MIQGKKILAVITARAGSRGVPKKNIIDLCGKPLIAYTIEAALQCEYIDEVMVTTDSNEIAEISRMYGASVPFLRSSDLATDTASSIAVVVDVVQFYKNKLNENYDIIMLLQPTSPLRTKDDIKAALELYMYSGMKSLASVCEVQDHPILIRTIQEGSLKGIVETKAAIRRQDMPRFYKVNGAIYINKEEEITMSLNFNNNEIAFIMEKDHSVDIDEPMDVELVRALIEKNL